MQTQYYGLTSLQTQFVERLQALKEQNGPVQLAVELPFMPAEDWLDSLKALPRWFWTDRLLSQVVAAAGEVLVWHDLQSVQQFLRSAPHAMRCYGGWSFEADTALQPPWQAWQPVHFFLPRWELRQLNEHSLLCVNLVESQKLQELEQAFELLQPAETQVPDPLLGELNHWPGREDWLRMVQAAQQTLQRTGLKKVVLSRVSQTHLPALSPRLMGRLLARRRQAYHFWFQPQADQVLWGASPERLYARQGRLIQTEALAGTRPLPENPELAEAYRQELLHSAKEQQENERVQQHLELGLKYLTLNLEMRPLTVIQAGPVQHLYRQFAGRLLEGVTDQQILQALHPTPAVSGFPSAEARQVLTQLEPHERGWYTGAMGWISADAAEWCVVLRAALWQHQQLHFYTGAGIMPDSDPAAEWDELEAKLLSLKTLFY